MEDLIYSYKGKTKIGFNFFASVRASWPISRIDFFDKEMIFSFMFFRKMIPYQKINGLVWSNGGYIKIEHSAGGFPYLAFWVISKNDSTIKKIDEIIKSKK